MRMNLQETESRQRRTLIAMNRLNKGSASLEDEIDESLRRAFEKVNKGMRPRKMSDWNSEGEIKSTIDDYDPDELERVIDNAVEGMSNKSKVNKLDKFVKGASDEEFFKNYDSKLDELKEDNEEDHFETFNQMVERLESNGEINKARKYTNNVKSDEIDFRKLADDLVKEQINKSNINKHITGGFTMSNREIILGTALELCREDKISNHDLTQIEGRLNKGAPLKEKWIELIKSKLGRRGYDADYEDENYRPTTEEAEADEEEESVKSKKKKKSAKVEYQSNVKSDILSEATVLCKSNKISLNELIATETCLGQGREIPSRVADLVGIEYEDEDLNKSYEYNDEEWEEIEKADIVTKNISSHTSPGEIVSNARGGDKLDETEDEFNSYFGLTKEEALARITDLHVSGKLDTMDVIKLESRIRRGIELPKEYKRFFKKGNWEV